MSLKLYILFPELFFFVFVFILIVKDYIIYNRNLQYNYMLSSITFLFFILSCLYVIELNAFLMFEFNIISNNNFYLTKVLILIKLMCTIISFCLLFLKNFRLSKKIKLVSYKNYLIVFCFSYFSLMLFIMSYNFITMLITLELLGLSCVILTTEFDSFNKHMYINLGSSLSYYLVHVCGSVIILLGVLIIYAVCGTLNFGKLSIILLENDQQQSILNLGFISLFIGLFLKIGLAPFYSWTLRAYNNLTMFNLAYFLIILKASFFCVIYQLLFLMPELMICLKELFLFIAFLNLIIGPIVTIQQSTIKKFLIGSSITNAGYFIICTCFNLQCFENTNMILFVITYSLSMLCFFFIEAILSIFHLNSSLLILSDLKRLPFVFKIQLFIILVSLMGFPPTINFFIKIKLLLYLFYFGTFVSLLIFVFSLLAMFYYISFIINVLSLKNIKSEVSNINNNNIIVYYISQYVITFILLLLLSFSFQTVLNFIPELLFN